MEFGEGFCNKCGYESKDIDDLKKYYQDRDELNPEDIWMLCKCCWEKQDKTDKFLYEQMNIIIQPLTWDNHKPDYSWNIYRVKKDDVKDDINEEIKIATAVEIKEEPKTTIINNITVVPNYINNYFLNPYDNKKSNQNIYKKLEKEKKLREKLEKIEKEKLEKEELERLQNEAFNLLKENELEKIQVEKEIDELIENERKKDVALNYQILNNPKIEQNKIQRRYRLEKEKYEIQQLEDKYGKNISKVDYKYLAIQTDEELKKKFECDFICDIKCHYCDILRAYPNDYVNRYKKAINEYDNGNINPSFLDKNGNLLYKCYECSKKKSDSVINFRDNNKKKCDLCNCWYYCFNEDQRIKHEESKRCINATKRNKLINGKKYTVLQLRNICKYNNIKNYKNMNKEEILNAILSIENYKIPEDL